MKFKNSEVWEKLFVSFCYKDIHFHKSYEGGEIQVLHFYNKHIHFDYYDILELQHVFSKGLTSLTYIMNGTTM